MGMFDWLIGKKVTVTGVDKYEWIRGLAKIRAEYESDLADGGFCASPLLSATIIDDLTKAQLSALPEATIVNIVVAWSSLKKKGYSDPQIIKKIEKANFSTRSELPTSLSLDDYVNFRVHRQHRIAPPSEFMIKSTTDSTKELAEKYPFFG